MQNEPEVEEPSTSAASGKGGGSTKTARTARTHEPEAGRVEQARAGGKTRYFFARLSAAESSSSFVPPDRDDGARSLSPLAARRARSPFLPLVSASASSPVLSSSKKTLSTVAMAGSETNARPQECRCRGPGAEVHRHRRKLLEREHPSRAQAQRRKSS